MTFSFVPSALSATMVALACLATTAQAQAPAWPAKNIRIVVPYAAGGSTDVLARLIGERLGKLLGQPAVVDNRASRRASDADVADVARLPTPP